MSADWLFKVGFNSAVEASAYRRDWAGTFLREVGVAISAALGREMGVHEATQQMRVTARFSAHLTFLNYLGLGPQFTVPQPHNWIDQ
jgi:hypothetical protein